MSKSYKIGVIKGDGIGPEIIDEAIKVLDAVSVAQGFTLKYEEMLLGGAAIDETGVPLPEETIQGVKNVMQFFLVRSVAQNGIILRDIFVLKQGFWVYVKRWEHLQT